MNYFDKLKISLKWQFGRKKNYLYVLYEIYCAWWLLIFEDLPLLIVNIISLISNLFFPIWYPIKFALEPFYAPLIKRQKRTDEHWIKLKELLEKEIK